VCCPKHLLIKVWTGDTVILQCWRTGIVCCEHSGLGSAKDI